MKIPNKNTCTSSPIFLQAVDEVLQSIEGIVDSNEKYKRHSILNRLLSPDRIVKFKIEWIDDNQNIQINTGYRVQFNNTLGPYKGGLRFHPSVNEDILSFLAFEQIFKNSLTGLPVGGAKGGSDFDPKGKSDFEVMRFCKAFMTELHKYIGPRMDIPAGDIGVGSRELGYLFSSYKQITSNHDGVLTGKPYVFGGSLMRPEATGYGLIYFVNKMLELENAEPLIEKKCVVSGSGNVALHAIEKLYQEKAIPVACSCSKGTLYHSEGLNIEVLRDIKLKKRGNLMEYIEHYPEATFTKVEDYKDNEHPIWNIECYAAFPCATQNELTELDAINLVKNGCRVVAEGANMPSTNEAIDIFHENNILFAPGKASNAGGVVVSGFEMSQNASMIPWSREEVDERLKAIMEDICLNINLTAKKHGATGSYVDGANIAGFIRVADAMVIEGV